MQGILHWILASPWRSGLAAAALALSRLFDIFGAGLIALVALRKGTVPGLQVALIALPLLVAAGYLAGLGFGLPLAVAGLWVPVLLLSEVLRRTGSMALALQAGALLAAAILAAWFVLSPEPIAMVRAFLDQQVLPLIQRMDGSAPQLGETERQAMARIAPGFMAAGSLFVAMLAVIIGRWWQAVAFNPGGFRRDFHRLRNGRSATLIVATAMLLAVLTGHPVVIGLALAGAVVLLFQGLAMAHGIVAATGQPAIWLWGMYVAAVLLPLPATVLLVMAGGIDNWMDFRRLAGQDVENSNE